MFAGDRIIDLWKNVIDVEKMDRFRYGNEYEGRKRLLEWCDWIKVQLAMTHQIKLKIDILPLVNIPEYYRGNNNINDNIKIVSDNRHYTEVLYCQYKLAKALAHFDAAEVIGLASEKKYRDTLAFFETSRTKLKYAIIETANTVYASEILETFKILVSSPGKQLNEHRVGIEQSIIRYEESIKSAYLAYELYERKKVECPEETALQIFGCKCVTLYDMPVVFKDPDNNATTSSVNVKPFEDYVFCKLYAFASRQKGNGCKKDKEKIEALTKKYKAAKDAYYKDIRSTEPRAVTWTVSDMKRIAKSFLPDNGLCDCPTAKDKKREEAELHDKESSGLGGLRQAMIEKERKRQEEERKASRPAEREGAAGPDVFVKYANEIVCEDGLHVELLAAKCRPRMMREQVVGVCYVHAALNIILNTRPLFDAVTKALTIRIDANKYSRKQNGQNLRGLDPRFTAGPQGHFLGAQQEIIQIVAKLADPESPEELKMWCKDTILYTALRDAEDVNEGTSESQSSDQSADALFLLAAKPAIMREHPGIDKNELLSIGDGGRQVETLFEILSSVGAQVLRTEDSFRAIFPDRTCFFARTEEVRENSKESRHDYLHNAQSSDNRSKQKVYMNSSNHSGWDRTGFFTIHNVTLGTPPNEEGHSIMYYRDEQHNINIVDSNSRKTWTSSQYLSKMDNPVGQRRPSVVTEITRCFSGKLKNVRSAQAGGGEGEVSDASAISDTLAMQIAGIRFGATADYYFISK